MNRDEFVSSCNQRFMDFVSSFGRTVVGHSKFNHSMIPDEVLEHSLFFYVGSNWSYFQFNLPWNEEIKEVVERSLFGNGYEVYNTNRINGSLLEITYVKNKDDCERFMLTVNYSASREGSTCRLIPVTQKVLKTEVVYRKFCPSNDIDYFEWDKEKQEYIYTGPEEIDETDRIIEQEE